MQYLFPLLAVFIWAGNTVVNKLAVGIIQPAEIGFFRWLLVGLALTPFMLGPVLRNRRYILANLGKFVVLGLLGMAVYQSLAYYAAALTSATNMGIILSLMPLMSLGLASSILAHRLNAGALLGALVSLAGVVLVISQGHLGALLEHGVNLGDAMMIVATLAYAVYSVLLKKWSLKLPAMQLLYLQVLVAILALLPLYLLSPRTGLNAANLPLVLYAALFASIVAALAWMHGVARLGPSRMALFFTLLPIITACIATLVLGERLTVHHLVGGALTLAGVLLAEFWQRRPARLRSATC
ncbi:DMT family transporter [Pseudomonas aeruginosa]|uniref:DMT family transporter n=1 Tax=Pseudomonas aeruginosa TaxID=287 RepID=UPI00126643CE|nr:DMT family transporter [Pseudomonas aeruginosa]MBO7968332.1 DMT family transporter [Pseudomonas aeruginosa]HEO1534015.1 DMT family transporter [Pseudomonas aeruginosa]